MENPEQLSLTIRKPDDFHLHLRQGESFIQYTKQAAKDFERALVMPNTIPPLTTAREVNDYREAILLSEPNFHPLLTFKLIPELSKKNINNLFKAQVCAAKFYPLGSTTNSGEGKNSWEDIYPQLEVLEELDIPLSIHGEDPSVFSLDREKAFIPVIEKINRRFPSLRIIMEHLSCRESIDFIKESSPLIRATITVHHMLLNLDDILGKHLNPDAFCKPIVKTPEDQRALITAATSGNPYFFFGSDSAPHPVQAKQKGAAGIFSSPVAMPLLAGIFEKEGKLDRLEDFTSRFGAEFYKLKLNSGSLTLKREKWTIPETIEGVPPLFAGRKIDWKTC